MSLVFLQQKFTDHSPKCQAMFWAVGQEPWTKQTKSLPVSQNRQNAMPFFLMRHCPIELSVKMEMFYNSSTVQYVSHQPHVAIEHLKCDWSD